MIYKKRFSFFLFKIFLILVGIIYLPACGTFYFREITSSSPEEHSIASSDPKIRANCEGQHDEVKIAIQMESMNSSGSLNGQSFVLLDDKGVKHFPKYWSTPVIAEKSYELPIQNSEVSRPNRINELLYGYTDPLVQFDYKPGQLILVSFLFVEIPEMDVDLVISDAKTRSQLFKVQCARRSRKYM